LLLSLVVDGIARGIGRKYAEKVAISSVGYVKAVVTLLFPLRILYAGVNRFIGGERRNKEQVTEEDIMQLVNVGNETGAIEEQQREMICNIFEFDDKTIAEVMTHRKDIVAIDVDAAIQDVVEIARSENYSRMPVYQDSIDNVIGMLMAKDLLGLIGCQNIQGFHVRLFLREVLFVPETAKCDEVVEINLSELVPLVACPHSPDNVKSVAEIGKLKVDQVCIGSCTNSSLLDMMKVAHILKGKTVHPDVSLAIAPGSKQVLNMMADMGLLGIMIDAGARILESACGPCIGMGQAPNSGGISLRTFNRNFLGRSGTKDGQIYLVSPELAAYSALTGYLSDPRELGEMPEFVLPEKFTVHDNMIVLPAAEEEMDSVEVLRGPNIKPFPETAPLEATIAAGCSLKVGDNITTDHIMPAGAKILPLRSNIPAISQHCFTVCDEAFPTRAKEMGKSIIVGGSNYGQGSSREHAALAPLYLGVKAVLVKSFARIHRANLVNAGILPLTFVNEADYDKISQGDMLELADVRAKVEAGETTLTLVNKTTGTEIPVLCELTGRTKDIILAGGLLNYTRENLSK